MLADGPTIGVMRRREHGALPLPACGERVGVRGAFDTNDVWRVPLTRIAARSDLSPQAGRGGGRQ